MKCLLLLESILRMKKEEYFFNFFSGRSNSETQALPSHEIIFQDSQNQDVVQFACVTPETCSLAPHGPGVAQGVSLVVTVFVFSKYMCSGYGDSKGIKVVVLIMVQTLAPYMVP